MSAWFMLMISSVISFSSSTYHGFPFLREQAWVCHGRLLKKNKFSLSSCEVKSWSGAAMGGLVKTIYCIPDEQDDDENDRGDEV